MNLSRKQKQTHGCREQVCGCQGGGGEEGMDWESGISRCKLVYIGWINNEVLQHRELYSISYDRDFPGGAGVKNLSANAGDMGSSPGPGRSHMPRSNEARVPQLLSLHSRACEPQLLSPHT